MQQSRLNKALACFCFCVAAYGSDYGNLFEKYGKIYNLPPQLLWGIAKQESGLDPIAVNKNSNGTYDLGLMQINSVHLRMLKTKGIDARDLFYPETNIAVGAYILSDCFKRYGQNWKGLTCYNGRIEGNDYAFKVLKNIYGELSANEHGNARISN